MKAAREAWFTAQPDLDPDKLVFLDETAAATNMACRYGRAPRGQRCRMAVPHGHVWTPPSGASKISGQALRVIGCCHVSGL